MHVCKYVRTFVCLHVYMYACMFLRRKTNCDALHLQSRGLQSRGDINQSSRSSCAYVCMYVYDVYGVSGLHVCAHMCACMYVWGFTYMCVNICVYVVYLCICTRSTNAYIHTYIYTYIHTCIHKHKLTGTAPQISSTRSSLFEFMHVCMHAYVHACIHKCIQKIFIHIKHLISKVCKA
jgi:hypothetical protein